MTAFIAMQCNAVPIMNTINMPFKPGKVNFFYT